MSQDTVTEPCLEPDKYSPERQSLIFKLTIYIAWKPAL